MDPSPDERAEVNEVLRAVGDLAQPLERAAVIERVGRVAAEAIGADLGFVGLLDGPDHLKLGAVHGSTTNALQTLRVERGRGLGGKVLSLGKPASVVEYTASDSITHEYDAQILREGLAGVLCLPLSVGDELLGVAYVSDRAPTHYTDVQLDRVVTAVESAKIALAMADRSQRLTEAAVQAERERTAQALDASVGEELGQILELARAIAADPESSTVLVQHASSIIETADRATAALHGSLRPPSEAVDAPAPCALTPREQEVVRLAARGLSNPEIATKLFLARGTVKAYMESILQKLDARNRVEAVMIAARTGLLDDV